MQKEQRSKYQAVQQIGMRLLFVYVTAVILVFFSEKSYWYIQGFDILGPALFYFFPTAIFLWSIEQFHVRRLGPLFLSAALYGFLVEGILAPILYQDGLFGWFHVSYTSLAWHAPLSVMFGFYFLRQWLLQANWRWLFSGSAAFGLLWGIWSLTFWLPENVNDADLLAEGFDLGIWSVGKFALFAFTITLVLALAHWLIGYFWQKHFSPGKVELGGILLFLAGYFVYGVIIPFPVAWVKLPLLLGIVWLGLRNGRKQESAPSLFVQLQGKIPITRLLPLLLMPLTAVIIYAAALQLQPSETVLRDLIYTPIVFVQTAFGWLLFLWGLWVTIRPLRTASPSHHSEAENAMR